jgi:hypothetical protein
LHFLGHLSPCSWWSTTLLVGSCKEEFNSDGIGYHAITLKFAMLLHILCNIFKFWVDVLSSLSVSVWFCQVSGESVKRINQVLMNKGLS